MASVYGFGGAPGGPFSNGQYFPNDGTYTAVVRGQNLVGTVNFSTSTTGGNGSAGVSTIYFDGNTYTGNSQGSYNAQGSTMVVNFQGASQAQGEGTFTSTNSTSGLVVTGSYFDSLSLNGEAQCRVKNAFPNQIFKGNGQAVFQNLDFSGQLPRLSKSLPIPVSVSGVRVADTASQFTPADVRPPSVSQYTETTP